MCIFKGLSKEPIVVVVVWNGGGAPILVSSFFVMLAVGNAVSPSNSLQSRACVGQFLSNK
eukprot:m.86795 g.86795  ORF g.86795 m.86795 type:complete len:60 (+) comp26003_c0_seq1:163-342(+)